MKPFIVKTFRAVRGLGLCTAVLVIGGAAAYVASVVTKSSAAPAGPSGSGPTEQAEQKIARYGTDGLVVPGDMVAKMGLRTATVAPPCRSIPLPPFQGVLALDNERLTRARSRFAGEVMEIGRSGPRPTDPPLQVGDRVSKGDLLAVIWSKDLGEKKNELVDALLRVKLDRDNLARYKSLDEGIIAQKQVREAEAAARASENAVAKAEATLRAWRLGEDEIRAVITKADALDGPDARRGLSADPNWARVEVRAAQDGSVLEKNVTAGDIVDTAANLFVVGDLSRLTVWAHVYEEDLALLQSLPRPLRWTVSLSSRPGTAFAGTLDKVGAVIDPTQHTALVSGTVENATGALKVGQTVTVAIELPLPTGEFEVPAAAVVEDGRESVAFVQPDSRENRFVRRPVSVIRRFRETVYVRTADAGVRPGDRVVTSGSLLLWQAFDQLPEGAPH